LQPENHPSGDSLIEAGSCILANWEQEEKQYLSITVIEFGKWISLKDLQLEKQNSGNSLIELGRLILVNWKQA
jgi:hypothetical protein